MQPLLQKIPNGDPTTNISKVFDIGTVLHKSGTVLDEEFQRNGCTLDLPAPVDGLFGPVSSIKLPPCPIYQDDGMVVLDEIAVRTNNVLRVRELVVKGEKDISVLGKSVCNLQMSIISRLIGKSGTVCRDVLGRRVANTSRAVLLPSYSHDPSIAYIPSDIMAKTGMKHGDAIIVGRDPTIWYGSLEVLIANRIDGSAIRLHPFVFSQLGADCDGDCVWAMAIPDELQSEMSAHVLSFTEIHATQVPLVGLGRPPIEIDWSDPEAASKSLWMSSGFSISPEDIVNDTEALRRFKEASGKDIGDEARSIAKADSNELVLDKLVTINLTMLIQKVWLGPVGAAAQKLKLISSRDKRLRTSANYLSEKMQQMLFDVKGSITGDQSDLDIFFELLHIVNMTGPYSSGVLVVTDDDAISRLVEMGLSEVDVRPIMAYIYSVFPLIQATLGAVDDDKREALIAIASSILDGTAKEDVVNQISDMTDIPTASIMSRCRTIKSSMTLGVVLSDPLYDLINPFSNERTSDAILSLGARISRPKKPITFSRLTDTIFDLSLESDIASSTNTDTEATSSGISMPCDSRRGGVRAHCIQDSTVGDNSEEKCAEA